MELDEAVAERSRQRLSAAVSSRRVLGGEDPEVGVGLWRKSRGSLTNLAVARLVTPPNTSMQQQSLIVLFTYFLWATKVGT